jgi:hypothetical protein
MALFMLCFACGAEMSLVQVVKASGELALLAHGLTRRNVRSRRKLTYTLRLLPREAANDGSLPFELRSLL